MHAARLSAGRRGRPFVLIFFPALGNANDAPMRARAWCGHWPGDESSAEKAFGRRFWDTEDVVFKARIVVLAATIALATWVAAIFVQGGAQLPGFVPPDVDTLALLS